MPAKKLSIREELMGIFDEFIYKNGEIVDNRWVKWYHFGVPDKEGEERTEIRNDLEIMNHCKPCSALSGCYFVKSKLPKKKGEGDGLLHSHCDCKLISIVKPITISTHCPIEKFSGYVFSEKYILNGKKKLFEEFGFSKSDSFYLKTEYERQAKEKYLNGDYEIRGLNPKYGQDINIIIELKTPSGRKVEIISGWKVHPLGVLTCNTPLADD